MPPFWAIALAGFFLTARATRFLNSDVLAQPIRDWFAIRFGTDSKVYYLVTCPWCASIWTGLPVAILTATTLSPYRPWPSIWITAGLWAGSSWLYGLISTNLDDE